MIVQKNKKEKENNNILEDFKEPLDIVINSYEIF